MGVLINVGFGNVVNMDKIIAVIHPEAEPVKRMIQSAKDEGRAIDATQGRRTRAVLVMESNHLVLSALQPETITGRCQNRDYAEHSGIMNNMVKEENNE